jgi:hypothetical protein
MGRANIRPRKKKHRPGQTPPEVPDTGIIADLEDQAAWSSYAQDIPRLGDPYREGIRLSRIRRSFTRLGQGGFDQEWLSAALTACAVGIAFVAALLGIVQLVKWIR